MQTPVDRCHWVGATSVLPGTPTAADYQSVADAYIARCRDVGIQVIGLTDHNLGGPDAEVFWQALKAAVERSGSEYQYRPTIFPGFEVEANVGRGLHLLCLFEPGTSHGHVSDVLASLGLTTAERFGAQGKPRPLPMDKDLVSILRVVQEQYHGLVIAAHPDNRHGACSDVDLAEFLQIEVITNEDLLCMELRRGRPAYEHDGGKFGSIVRNDPGDWHRQHPIAVISSSDCKRLTEGDGEGSESWIGRRFTWVKMSMPCIEGLRQAFLDHESRIAFGETRPEDRETHPQIQSITVSGASFLADQRLLLSPNFNALIGGGGTGKSTLVEYLRAVLGSQPTTSHDVLENHERAMASLGIGTVVLELCQGDERFEMRSGEGSSHTATAAVRFPIVAFSQREVFAVAESKEATLALLDQLQRDRMDELARAERRAAGLFQALASELAVLPERRNQRDKIIAELHRVDAVLTAIEKRQAPLAALNQHRREDEAVQAIDAAMLRVAGEIEAASESITLGISMDAPGPVQLPHADAFTALLERASSAVAKAAAEVRQAAERLRVLQSEERKADERSQWARELADAQLAYDALVASDADSSGQPEALRASKLKLLQERDELEGEIEGLEAKVPELPRRREAVREVWQDQIGCRRGLADRLQQLVPKTKQDTPYVVVTVQPFRDLEPLSKKLTGWVHGRSMSDDEAKSLCELAYAVADQDGQSSVDVVADWIRRLARDDHPEELSEFRQPVLKGLVRDVPEARLLELEQLRLPDVAEVTLRRQDGTEAGTLSGGLSVGQRCTAILALALAAGNEPIIIDQPEDEIDNEFIYTELVPLLRAAKKTRQVIISTHNPNLPVNGDAELIYALAANQEHGAVRGSCRAQGSLDRKDVKDAVEMIMEGSREAFERRKVRYGF